MTRNLQINWLLVTAIALCVGNVFCKPAIKNIKRNIQDSNSVSEDSSTNENSESNGEIDTENEESPVRRPGSTDPGDENIASGNYTAGGVFFDAADWIKEAEQWNFKGGDWGLVTLPNDEHPDIPIPPVPGPVLIAEGDSMSKVFVSRSEENLENLTLHFSYFLTNNPENPPLLEVYQIQDDTNSERVSVETTYGEWTTSTISLPYSGKFEIKFIGQRVVDTNEIALDDIILRGYYVNQNIASQNTTLEEENEVSDDGETDAVEEGNQITDVDKQTVNEGDQEVNTDVETAEDGQDIVNDTQNAEVDQDADNNEGELTNNTITLDTGNEIQTNEDNEIEDYEDENTEDEDNEVDDIDDDNNGDEVEDNENEDNYYEDNEKIEIENEDNENEDKVTQETVKDEEEINPNEYDDSTTGSGNYWDYSGSGDYDDYYDNGWFGNINDWLYNDDDFKDPKPAPAADSNKPLDSLDTDEFSVLSEEDLEEAGTGGAVITFWTVSVLGFVFLGFLFWKRRRGGDEERTIFNRITAGQNDFDRLMYNEVPYEDDGMNSKDYKSFEK